jgi:GNAT superfamily N-acetyltransferase
MLISRFEVDDLVLSELHARAFGVAVEVRPWRERLARHALSWVGAFEEERLVGFVQVGWDGGEHAFLLDTAVDPRWQRRGMGAALVRAAIADARAGGCTWLHVDFEPHLRAFYLESSGFRPTDAGLMAL